MFIWQYLFLARLSTFDIGVVWEKKISYFILVTIMKAYLKYVFQVNIGEE